MAELHDTIAGILIAEGFAKRADTVAARIITAVDEHPLMLPAAAIRYFAPDHAGGGFVVEWRDLPPISDTLAVLDRLFDPTEGVPTPTEGVSP